MKLLLLGTFLYSCTSIYGQQQKFTTLKFTAHDSRFKKSGNQNYLFPIFRFFKLPEDTLAYRIDIYKLDTTSVTLENIRVSKYRLEYFDIYHRKIKKIITLSDTTENILIVYPDSLNKKKYKRNTLAKLKTNDSIVVYFRSFHMHYLESRIVIKKTDTNFVAVLYEKNGMERAFKEVNRRLLSEDNMSAFVRFENEIMAVKEDWCSMDSWYSITSKYTNLHKNGGECTWGGFSFLWSSFYGKPR